MPAQAARGSQHIQIVRSTWRRLATTYQLWHNRDVISSIVVVAPDPNGSRVNRSLPINSTFEDVCGSTLHRQRWRSNSSSSITAVQHKPNIEWQDLRRTGPTNCVKLSNRHVKTNTYRQLVNVTKQPKWPSRRTRKNKKPAFGSKNIIFDFVFEISDMKRVRRVFARVTA